MYNINDFFEMVRSCLQVMMKCLPYIMIHFVVLIIMRRFLLKAFQFCRSSGGALFCPESALLYRSSLLVVMLIFSWVVSMVVYLHMGISFYFFGDFVFMAGVLLGWRKGWFVLLVNLVFLPLWFYYIERSVLIIFYLMFDAVIYFTIGLFSGSQYDFMEGEYGCNDIFLICVNKLIAALVSAACWVLLVQESWFAGINLLIFRLVGWPFASLPMIFLVLYLMKQDRRQLLLRPA